MQDDDIAISELEIQFNEASRRVVGFAAKLDSFNALYLYARYKQATEGPCTTDRPSRWFDVKNKQKWDAWKALGKVSKDLAMQEYIALVKKLDPEFSEETKYGAEASRSKEIGGGFGISVSTPLNQETCIEDRSKTVFDWAKEGNVEYVEKLLDTDSLPVDEDGLTPLHWACDRGHLALVEALLKRFPDRINVTDPAQQTPLHYASYCSHSEVVALLMKSGADPTLKDEDGVDCVADVEQILKALEKT
ncbi:acyl-CoA-binding domain-containing protein 6-like isoform X2 [Varroa jacobsoni]|uniref:acyl-CoA-binding domain-containing protein 6-like isoform X2 n=1 Tax=Varroa jacobsoni TaxID=62625 RepID=UPI000BF5F878|nr:acyl-CoA-binding domain-containing protein 6-like isoform X2 [Varroa jacobsoni]XP_022696405.1 acyl-CoA-binding domain-containing protein 6-like isoform X2 [Varroa jacobsoni]